MTIAQLHTNVALHTLLVGLAAVLFLTCDHPTGVRDRPDFPLIPTPEKTGIPDSVLTSYQNDANRLAVRYMHETSNTSVEIPVDLSKTLFNGLIHIYNKRDLPARDTVVDIYPIHTLGGPYLHDLTEIILIVNGTREWVQQWKKGERFTGNSAIDSLMSQYDLSLKKYYVSPWGSEWAVLRSSRALNIKQLAERFKEIDGVVTAEPNGSCCDGNNIIAAKGVDWWDYTFLLGWGDCPSGCIASRFWDFRVSADGTVEYLGSRGDPIPPSGIR